MATPVTEGSSLLSNAQKAFISASAGANLLRTSVQSLQQARQAGRNPFRAMAFGGGVAMVFSNSLSVLDRFFSFNFTGALIAVYGLLFGLLIALLEIPPNLSAQLSEKTSLYQATVLFYAKFLEFVWGRGAFYFFVGSLQIANWNLLDWAVGGFMIFVGATEVSVSLAAARHIQQVRANLHDEGELKKKWHQQASFGSSSLDVKQFTKFVNDANVNMSTHEIAAIFLSLDKNFDDKLSFEEFQSWWLSSGNTSIPNIAV